MDNADVVDLQSSQAELLVPDFTGQTIREALTLIGDYRNQIKISGQGRIIAQEPVPAAEAEMPESFPTFDDVEPEPLPPVIEEPEPAQPVMAEPEPVPYPVVEPEPEPAFEFDATMPDFTPEQAMEPPLPPPVEPIEEPSGGSNRNLIIAVVVILLLCCCCLIVSAVVYSTVDSVQDTFQDLIDEATASTMSTAIASLLR